MEQDGSMLVLSGAIYTEGDTRILLSLVPEAGATPADVLRPAFDALGSGTTSDGIIHFTVNGHPAARINARNTITPDVGLTQIAVDMGGEQFFVALIGVAPFGDPDFETTLLAILASARLTG